jgi:hypothetical protein
VRATASKPTSEDTSYEYAKFVLLKRSKVPTTSTKPARPSIVTWSFLRDNSLSPSTASMAQSRDTHEAISDCALPLNVLLKEPRLLAELMTSWFCRDLESGGQGLTPIL